MNALPIINLVQAVFVLIVEIKKYIQIFKTKKIPQIKKLSFVLAQNLDVIKNIVNVIKKA